MNDELQSYLREIQGQLESASELLDAVDSTPFGKIEYLLDRLAGRIHSAQRFADSALKARELA